tara:strand:- start:289 stop:492 length:204 start_codon:yes stop_codon:yes gene_type:complete
MEIKIICNCPKCDGYGFVTDRHPNDPSSKDIVCHECEGDGKKIFVDVYDSIADAQDDYPEAVGFTYL